MGGNPLKCVFTPIQVTAELAFGTIIVPKPSRKGIHAAVHIEIV